MFHLFRIFLCLGLYTVTIFFFETFKNYILKILIISLQLLIFYSLLAQLWVHSPRVNSSDDIKLNPRPKGMFFSASLQFDPVASHNFNCSRLNT